jgi:C1A family cysteine protease
MYIMKKYFLQPWILGFIALMAVGFSQDVVVAATEIEHIQQAIEAHGAQWRAGENWVTKLSAEERRKLCGHIREPIEPSQATLLSLPAIEDLPPVFDWRDNNGNWVTPVRNQGNCGSCWDFSAVAQVEAWWNVHNDDPSLMVNLSEQFVLSCSDGGCDGWSVTGALEFIRSTGIPTEACFPYRADDRVPCASACEEWTDEALTIPGWGYVTLMEDNIENIKNALYRHPVSASYDVYSDFFAYEGGVYEHVYGPYEAGHAILIVGWNDEEQSWICKNSWGPTWGESGYFRIRWGNCGMGEYMPFIWDQMSSGPALEVSPDQFEFTLVNGDSAEETITITNSGPDAIEFSVMDFDVDVYIAFHPDAFMAWDDYSWWCGDPGIGGYSNHWLQYLDTPVLDLSGTSNPLLSWMGYWSVESPDDPQAPYDGWDGCNVWVSVNGGTSFEVVQPNSPMYNCQSLWSFGHPEQGWNFGEGIGGWGGSSGGWVPCEYDLSLFRSNSVIIRFAFASDLAFCTQDDASLHGFFVDEIKVSDGSETIFLDHGDDIETMTRYGYAGEFDENSWIEITGGMGQLLPHESAQANMSIRTSHLGSGRYDGWIRVMSSHETAPTVEIPVSLEVIKDVDEDGTIDEEDNCPDQYNPGQEDVDEDGYGDLCDNCPEAFNPDQEDIDGDGIGDICDICPDDPDNDVDEDGLCVHEDNCPCVSNPDQTDGDGDGFGDACEAFRGDVDGNCSVNVLDVLSVVNFILGQEASAYESGASDCNVDGIVNILDALGIVNVVLDIGQCGPGACSPVINDEVMTFIKSLRPYLASEDFDRLMVLVKGVKAIPQEYALAQNYPNPFNPTTAIRYEIAESKFPIHTTLTVYNTLGQEIRTLVDKVQEPGYYTVTWDGRDQRGVMASSGIYFYRLMIGDFSASKRMVLMK